LEKDNKTAGTWWNVAESITANHLQFLKKIDEIASNNTETKSLIIFTFNDKMFPPGVLSWISGKG